MEYILNKKALKSRTEKEQALEKRMIGNLKRTQIEDFELALLEKRIDQRGTVHPKPVPLGYKPKTARQPTPDNDFHLTVGSAEPQNELFLAN